VSAADVKTGDTFRETDSMGKPCSHMPVYEVTETVGRNAYLFARGWVGFSSLTDPSFWTRVTAVEQVPAARLAERDALIRRLRDVATGATPHDWTGACPEGFSGNDGTTYEDRDNLCPACVVLMEADALLGGKVTP
jgi:hypothetical protein